MKLAFQLAYKNLIGAGLRTWLNVGVLTFSFLIIIFYNALLDGWNEQAKVDSVAWEFGNGQVINNNYDQYDPFSIQDGHGVLQDTSNLSPVLVRQASIYPGGRMISVALIGLDKYQSILELPTHKLAESREDIPAIIGKMMAKSCGLKIGDQFLLRWRDKNGTFDAVNVTIVDVFKTDVPTIDKGKIFVPIQKLWEMTDLQNHASYYVANKSYKAKNIAGWHYDDLNKMLKNINEVIAMKRVSSSIVYLLLLAIALLAIFDTQVLSVFRRQKEIGTYIALGMTRSQVVGIFTVEGSMYSVFAVIISTIIGIPLFNYLAQKGIAFPATTSQDAGFAVADRVFPIFGFKLLITTVVSVVIAATIVSFMPAKKISKMNPVDALKGKVQ